MGGLDEGFGARGRGGGEGGEGGEGGWEQGGKGRGGNGDRTPKIKERERKRKGKRRVFEKRIEMTKKKKKKKQNKEKREKKCFLGAIFQPVKKKILLSSFCVYFHTIIERISFIEVFFRRSEKVRPFASGKKHKAKGKLGKKRRVKKKKIKIP